MLRWSSNTPRSAYGIAISRPSAIGPVRSSVIAMTSFQPCGEFLNARVYLTRGRSREQAAAHIGVGTTTFDQMIADGRMPQPRIIGGRVVWCVYELDEYFDRLPHPSLSPESSSVAFSNGFRKTTLHHWGSTLTRSSLSPKTWRSFLTRHESVHPRPQPRSASKITHLPNRLKKSEALTLIPAIV